MSRPIPMILIALALILSATSAFQQALSFTRGQSPSVDTSLNVATKKGAYIPKWKKLKTVDGAGLDDSEKGLAGAVPVVFQSGNQTITTTAFVGQPVSDVAAQCGQFIKYGCGKGECGTCESLCGGKWIRPCVATIPADVLDGEKYTIVVKETKARASSSGKFYSVRSFFMGFYNNAIGMIGFVRTRKAAEKNWSERQEYEDLIAQKIALKKLNREATDGSLK